jgi:uncharacterized protein YjbI with pentapeptide repeats
MEKTLLNDILEKHKLWISGSDGGVKAVLSDADLKGADLSDADLSDANLFGANLGGVNLSDANLNGVDLNGADLSGTRGIKTVYPKTGEFFCYKKRCC